MPHHSASLPALVGGGIRAKPGEVSLAHLGVLFLDELPEFQRPALESLRQPIETGRVSVARANAHVTYPARFQLVAAMNPWGLGYGEDLEIWTFQDDFPSPTTVKRERSGLMNVFLQWSTHQ